MKAKLVASLMLAATAAACDDDNPLRDGRAGFSENPVAVQPAGALPLEADFSPPEDPFAPPALRRGQERFAIYCTPCHGPAGEGDGIVVENGIGAPPSFHEDRLRDLALEEIVAVIADGKGRMQPMAGQIPHDDRWAIAAYVKALQLSRHPDAEALERRLLGPDAEEAQ